MVPLIEPLKGTLLAVRVGAEFRVSGCLLAWVLGAGFVGPGVAGLGFRASRL